MLLAKPNMLPAGTSYFSLSALDLGAMAAPMLSPDRSAVIATFTTTQVPPRASQAGTRADIRRPLVPAAAAAQIDAGHSLNPCHSPTEDRCRRKP